MHTQLVSVKRSNKMKSGKANCEPGWCWQPPPLSDYDLWYVLSGKGRMKLAKQDYPLSRGDCFLLRPGDCPDAIQDLSDRLSVIFIHLDAFDLATGLQVDPDRMPERYTRIGDTVLFEMLLNRFLQMEHPDNHWNTLEAELILQQLLVHLYRWQEDEHEDASAGRQRQLVQRVSSHIREYPGRRFTHQELAELVQLSPEYLSLLFKKHMGKPIKSFLTDVRLERAMHLLMETPMNVSQVAEALGYANVYLFSKQFKERYEAPPSRFKGQGVPARSHGAPKSSKDDISS